MPVHRENNMKFVMNSGISSPKTKVLIFESTVLEIGKILHHCPSYNELE